MAAVIGFLPFRAPPERVRWQRSARRRYCLYRQCR